LPGQRLTDNAESSRDDSAFSGCVCGCGCQWGYERQGCERSDRHGGAFFGTATPGTTESTSDDGWRLSVATVTRLEKGRMKNPTVDVLERYAKAVGRELHLSVSAAK